MTTSTTHVSFTDTTLPGMVGFGSSIQEARRDLQRQCRERIAELEEITSKGIPLPPYVSSSWDRMTGFLKRKEPS